MKVSVIIPVYKAAAFVSEAVRSALVCLEVGELLLVEDGSPDESLAVCQRLAVEHDSVRLLRHPNGENRGAGESRNVAIRAAACEVVSFLDADDVYLSHRLSRAVALLSDRPDVDGVYEAVGTSYDIEDQRRWWLEQAGKPDVTRMRSGMDSEELFEELFVGRGGWIHTNGITVRKSLFERTGLFNPDLRMCQDAEMWFKMAAVGRLFPGDLEEPVAMRRLHGENRIFRQRDEHAEWHRKMRESLWSWIRDQPTDPDNVALVAASTLRDRMSRVNNSVRGWRWRAAAAREAARLAAEWPAGLKVPAFRRLLRDCGQNVFRLPGVVKRRCEVKQS